MARPEALIGPQLARLADRFGQTRRLPFCLLAHGAAIACVLASTTPAASIAAATCAGAVVPQLGALSAARWANLLRGDRADELPTAFSLESLANATAFLLLALLNLATGLYFGTMGVSVSSFAAGQGAPGEAAPIFAAASLSGLLSGWIYGLRPHRARARRQLVIAAAYLTGAALLLPLAQAPAAGLILLALSLALSARLRSTAAVTGSRHRSSTG